jgi:DNA-binding GntR family transcriptional regulator
MSKAPNTSDALDQGTVHRGDLVDRIAQKLRDAIALGEIAPGSRIVEARLAREFDISRAPIREAARKLESEGLLVSIHGRGFFVRQLTLGELQELLEVRLLIECEAARRAARNFGPALQAELDNAFQHIMDVAISGSVTDRINADLEFHRRVVAASANRLLLQIFSGIAVELKMALQLLQRTSPNEREMAASHRNVIEAIASRNEEAAADSMAEHIRLSWDDTMAEVRKASEAMVLFRSVK